MNPNSAAARRRKAAQSSSSVTKTTDNNAFDQSFDDDFFGNDPFPKGSGEFGYALYLLNEIPVSLYKFDEIS